MAIDPRLIFMFLVFATVFSFGQAAWGLFGVQRARRAVNRRLATAERAGSLGELVLELRKSGESPRTDDPSSAGAGSPTSSCAPA
jgi:hypothetical protein